MKIRIVHILLFLSFSCCLQCKKPEVVNYKLFGTIANSRTNEPIQGVEVKLSAKVLREGTFNNSFQPLETLNSNSQGYFEFNIEKEAFSSLKIQLEKELHLSYESEFNPELIHPSDGLDLSQELDPLAFVNLKVKNVNPFDENDQLIFRYTSSYFPQCVCCNNQFQYFNGMAVDTTVTCTIIGETLLEYSYSIVRGGASTDFLDSDFIESFETETIEIDY